MILTDTHAHIYDEAFDQDRAEVMQRALTAGVERIFLPAIDSESHWAMFEMCREYPRNCMPMMGLHPTSVNDNPRYGEELLLVERYLESPPEGIERFVALGEIGLDLYWSAEWQRQQVEAFERQIELSILYGLPMVIHTRSAWPLMHEVLGRYKGRGIRGVMHAFSGSFDDYRRIKDYGDFVFGIGGVLTYKKGDITDMLPRIPPQDVVFETDCPYLTPAPFRGKRNESGYLKYICDKAAELWGITVEQAAAVTTENSKRIFGI